MAGAAPAGSGGRAGTPFQHDWEALVRGDALKREDIYRQRVFGNNSGAKNFIEFEDRREFKWPMLVLYVIFIVISYSYSNVRMKIQVYFKVNNAVREAIYTTPFDADPVPRYFSDITTMKDVQDFLLNAFPVIVAPEVQHFNVPIGAVRFTMRKMKTEVNEGDRFNAFEPTVWSNTAGIKPDETSDKDDNQDSFGTYRVWTNASLSWPDVDSGSPENKRCPTKSALIDKVAFPGMLELDRLDNCKQWCEQLIYPMTCHCFTMSKMPDGTCHFYQVDADAFVSGLPEGNIMSQDTHHVSDQHVKRPLLVQVSGMAAYYPEMLQFAYTPGSTGYKETPGFIQSFKILSQEAMDAAMALSGRAETTPQRLINNVIDDWLQGGYLADASTLTVDFATFNAHYDCFSWVQLMFKVAATGYVEPTLAVESIQISNERDVNEDWTLADELWGDLVNTLYVIFVVLYLAIELWEMCVCKRGLKYFASLWNWITLVSVLLHLVTIILWWQYKMDLPFVKQLKDLKKPGMTPDFAPEGPNMFDTLNGLGLQIEKHRVFKTVCSFTLFFLLMQLLRYLSDIQPRVAVLMDTVSNAVVPIGFMAFVTITVLIGVCICTFVVFGREVKDFSDVPDAIRTIFLLTIGEFGALGGLRETFGDSSFLFYLPYMTFNIIVIVNFPRAVLNAAYEDAHAAHMQNLSKESSRQRAMDSNNTSDMNRMKKMVFSFFVKMFPDDFNARDMQKLVAKHCQPTKFRRSAMGGYLCFNVLFLCMTYLITRTEKSNRMMETVEAAIRSPEFTRTNPITGEIIDGGKFDTIRTRSDVYSFFVQALPAAMYESSHGTFDGDPNFLKEYFSAYPSIFQQLVINNWNIVVGQKPIRITNFVSQVKELGGAAITGVSMPTEKIRATKSDKVPADPALAGRIDGLPDANFEPAISVSSVENTKQRMILSPPYCDYTYGYGAVISQNDENPDKKGYGFVCQLPVNETIFRRDLNRMRRNHMVTEQTLSLAFEFVIYNAYAKTFGYVTVWFGFDPSGTIYKDIRVESITLELYSDFLGICQLIVEILVLLLNLIYFLLLMITLVQTIRDSKDEKRAHEGGKGPHGATRVCGWIQTAVCFFLFDLLNPLELISCIVTIVTMCFWYNVVFSALAQSYFFMEQPVWVQGQCDANNFAWCSDSEVITQFFDAQKAFRLFIQMCAVNTILVFLRVLRFLRPFPHMRVIFFTFGRAFGDLIWFVVVYVVILLAYTFLGHYIFGTDQSDYSTFIDSVRTCFEMFLGTVDFEAFSEAPWGMMFCFTVTFWFVLKLLAFNMFLAIIDKNYQEEKAAAAEDERRRKEEMKDEDVKKVGFFTSMKNTMKSIIKGSKKGGGDSPAKAAEAPAEVAGAAEPASGENPQSAEATNNEEKSEDGGVAAELGDLLVASGVNDTLLMMGSQHEADFGGEEEMERELEEDEVDKEIVRSKVHDERWKKLPEEIKDWAIDKAQGLVRFLADDEHLSKIWRKAQDQEREEDLGSLHEVMLENAESNMKKKKKELSQEQRRARRELDEAELSELKKVHQDQESLSWYIMKREAELKKLESQKELKKDRFDKLVNAAKSLIAANQDSDQQVNGTTNGVRTNGIRDY